MSQLSASNANSSVKDTAQLVAIARAIHVREGRGPDFLAWYFLSRSSKLFCLKIFRLAIEAIWRLIWNYSVRQPGLYQFIAARTIIYDRFLILALKDVKQLVWLGAGYDSRPYRFKELIQAAGVKKIFELDLPATQFRKLQYICRSTEVFPDVSHVTFVPIDFSKDSLEKRLLEEGFDPSLPTYFHWEGVASYLRPQDVDAVFHFIKTRGGPRSYLAWNGAFKGVHEHPERYYGAKETMRIVASRGEPYSGFGIPDDVSSIEEFHRMRGFRLEKLFMPRDLSAVLAPEVRAEGPPLAFHALMLARVDASSIILNQLEGT